MHPAELWHIEDDHVRCELCPNACLIAPGHTGVCGVRRNDEGALVALSYGVVSSVAVDPIEKKPVFHYVPGAPVLSVGSVGCSMRCGHCQNWQISRAQADDDPALRTMQPAQVVDAALQQGCPGVAFTYNEPVIAIEFVRDTARLCHEAGLFTVMVTNGYITQSGLDLLGEHIDVWRVDIKGARDETYRELCHVSSLAPIHAAAQRARRYWGMHVEVVTNIIPTINDSTEDLGAIAQWILLALGADTPWHVTRFFPYLDYAHLEPTPADTLRLARSIGHERGLSFVYLGNIDEPGGEDTICPRCGALCVNRSGYTIIGKNTRDGMCAQCGASLNLVE